ncbi:MAG: spore coat protein CotJB [Oscillospiraceae bacterium]|nr:spore coat protein CotJB [Oscillospiraceae bacterium]
MNRAELLRAIQIADFALVEANLFLDSHPDDENALRYYGTYKKRLDELTEDYVNQFGPLTARQYEGWDRWKWVDEPFPWFPDANR